MKHLIIIIICSVLSFFTVRSHIWGLIHMELKEKSLKKKRANQTLREKFVFSKFKDYIKRPSFLIWYYLHTVISIVATIIIFALVMIDYNDEYIKIIVLIVLCLQILPSAVAFLLYKDRRCSSGWNYYKWTSLDK